MCQTIALSASLYVLLQDADDVIADDAQHQECPHCGGPLHVASYPRKPRGGPVDLPESYLRRYSFCCGRCRRRLTPPSLRFLGRRIYLAAVVVVVSISRHGLSAKRLARLRELLDDGKGTISRTTVERWRSWWSDIFPTGSFWKARRGDFRHAVDEQELPGSLLECFGGLHAAGLLAMLRWLRPITTGSWFFEPAV